MEVCHAAILIRNMWGKCVWLLVKHDCLHCSRAPHPITHRPNTQAKVLLVPRGPGDWHTQPPSFPFIHTHSNFILYIYYTHRHRKGGWRVAKVILKSQSSCVIRSKCYVLFCTRGRCKQCRSCAWVWQASHFIFNGQHLTKKDMLQKARSIWNSAIIIDALTSIKMITY